MSNTPRNFALQLGSLAALYASLGALITLLFSVVTLALPDAADSYWEIESASESIRFSFAMLVIFFPAYLMLTRTVNTIRRHDEGGAYLSLTRWLIYLSLFVGGAILLGDAVAVVYSWLNGELTLRFFLKALILAVVIASAFTYYLYDAKGYWQTHEQRSIYCGAVALMVVLASLVLGFYFMESPAEVRERNIDELQLQDLRETQYRIQSHLNETGELPDTLAELYTINQAPEAPEGRADYRYEVTETGFTLCAEFGQASQRDDYYYPRDFPFTETERPQLVNSDNWEHEAGDWCFERTFSSNE
jgi:hypothetical protein